MWSHSRTEGFAPAALAALLAACGSTPGVAPQAPRASVETPPAAQRDASSRSPAGTPAVAPVGAGAALPPPVEVPARAAADFARAIALMQSGQSGEAELELQQLAAGYPQLAGPHANLGLLHRKAGRLDAAILELQAAAERSPANAVVWNELGVTLRMRGDFEAAAAAYERAIAVDPGFAPTHRNLGVLRDLYLGDPHGALAALEQYRSLTGEDKPVTSWIAELRQRTGTAAPPPVAADPAEPPPPAPEDTQPAADEAQAAESSPQPNEEGRS